LEQPSAISVLHTFTCCAVAAAGYTLVPADVLIFKSATLK